MGLQVVYYNPPGAHVSSYNDTDNINVYEIALNILDEYFFPKQSQIYERHIFRLIEQNSTEKFEKFKKSSDKMSVHKFWWVSCQPNNGDGVNLNNIIAEANALKAVARQMRELEDQ